MIFKRNFFMFVMIVSAFLVRNINNACAVETPYTLNTADGTCTDCEDNLRQHVIDGNICLECSANQFLIDNGGVKSCVACTSPNQHQQITGNLCIECGAGKFMKNTDGVISCIDCNQAGEYQLTNNGIRTCVACNLANQHQIQPNTCLECNSLQYLKDTNGTKTCIACDQDGEVKYTSTHRTCQTCGVDEFEEDNVDCVFQCKLGSHKFYTPTTNYGFCKECGVNEFYQAGSCVSSCSIKGLRADTTTKKCIPCTNNNYLYNSSCSPSCPVSTISVIDYYRYCQDCPVDQFVEDNVCVSRCLKDRGFKKSDKTCGICANDKFYISESQQCLDVCPSYTVIVNTSPKKCLYCPTGSFFEDGLCTPKCQKKWNAENSSSKACLPCATNQFAYLGGCVSTCPAKTISLTTPFPYCTPCLNNEVIYNNTCVAECPAGFYLTDNDDSMICKECEQFHDLDTNECISSCKAYQKVTLNTNTEFKYKGSCISCASLYNSDTNECVSSCPENFENVKSVCVKITPPPKKVFLGNILVDSCPLGYRKNSRETCEKCFTSDCFEPCFNGELSRKIDPATLPSNLLSHPNLNKLSIMNYRFNQALFTCERCLNLIDNNTNTKTRFCQTSCPNGYYNINNKDQPLNCQKCERFYENSFCVNNCSESMSISTNNECIKCKDLGLYNQNGKCVTSCSSNFIQNAYTKECESCTNEFCNNNGKCDIVLNKKVCNCSTDFYGSNCELKGQTQAKETLNKKQDFIIKELKSWNSRPLNNTEMDYIRDFLKLSTNLNVERSQIVNNKLDSLINSQTEFLRTLAKKQIPNQGSFVVFDSSGYVSTNITNNTNSTNAQNNTSSNSTSNNSNNNSNSTTNSTLRNLQSNSSQNQISPNDLLEEDRNKYLLSSTNDVFELYSIYLENIKEKSFQEATLTKAYNLANEISQTYFKNVTKMREVFSNWFIANTNSFKIQVFDNLINRRIFDNVADYNLNPINNNTNSTNNSTGTNSTNTNTTNTNTTNTNTTNTNTTNTNTTSTNTTNTNTTATNSTNTNTTSTNSTTLRRILQQNTSTNSTSNNSNSNSPVVQTNVKTLVGASLLYEPILVDFASCEIKLRLSNELKSNDKIFSMSLVSTDNTIKDTNSSLVPSDTIVYHNLVNNASASLNISSCSNIDYYLPIKSNDESFRNNLENKYSMIKEKYNSDIFNQSSKFLNSFCISYSHDGKTDTTFNRRRQIFKFHNKCSGNCKYLGIVENTYTVCRCPPNEQNIYSQFMESDYSNTTLYRNKNNSNVRIIDCDGEALKSVNIRTNIGFWLIFVQSVLTLFVLVVYFIFKNDLYVKDHRSIIFTSDTLENMPMIDEKIKKEEDNHNVNINNLNSERKKDKNEEFANQMRDKLNNHERNNNSDKKDEDLNENPELYTAHRNKISGQTDYDTENQLSGGLSISIQKHSIARFILLDFKYNHSIFNLVYNRSQVYPFWLRAIILSVSCTLDLLIICLCYTDRVIEKRSDYATVNGYDSIGFLYSFRKEVVHAIIATVISIPIIYCFTLIVKVSTEQKNKLSSSLSDIFRYENEL